MARILIVEDEMVIAEDLSTVLMRLNHEVVGIALKYTHAIDLLEKTKPDIALIDIILGGAKDGIDVANFINQNNKIPFVFITSHADTATVERAKSVKPNGYLVKPFNKNDIFTTIEMVLVNSARNSDELLERVLSKLSDREKEVYKVLLEGKSDQEIADKLFISIHTVKAHIKKIYEKLEVKTRLEAVSLIH
jgi:DNA-binding NarL/FixJ family response regulator